ncbi:MAG: metal-sensing transcriptional repressor [Chloroflexota bacterium]
MADRPAPHDHAAPVADAHPHARRPDVKRRLARAAGHLEAVRRMVDADRDCPELLRQIAAVRAALDATARLVLADHMESCLRGAARGEPERAWDDLKGALETFIR